MVTRNDEDKIIVEPDGQVSAAVIWLHGLGADGHDFEAIVPQLPAANQRGIRFIFPHAPMRPVTLNNGYVMRAWYDIVAINKTAKQDEAGMRASALLIEALIKEQLDQGLDCSKIVLAGFSQGGAVVLHTALRYAQRLAGVMALSCYLPLHDKVVSEISNENKGVPLLMAHGRMDDVVPMTMGVESRDYLSSLGYTVDWQSYDMPHSVCAEEIEYIDRWLCEVLR